MFILILIIIIFTMLAYEFYSYLLIFKLNYFSKCLLLLIYFLHLSILNITKKSKILTITKDYYIYLYKTYSYIKNNAYSV